MCVNFAFVERLKLRHSTTSELINWVFFSHSRQFEQLNGSIKTHTHTLYRCLSKWISTRMCFLHNLPLSVVVVIVVVVLKEQKEKAKHFWWHVVVVSLRWLAVELLFVSLTNVLSSVNEFFTRMIHNNCKKKSIWPKVFLKWFFCYFLCIFGTIFCFFSEMRLMSLLSWMLINEIKEISTYLR